MAIVTMKQLLEAGVHFGHRSRRWNPKMRSYIFTERNGIHIIDLQQTIRTWNWPMTLCATWLPRVATSSLWAPSARRKKMSPSKRSAVACPLSPSAGWVAR